MDFPIDRETRVAVETLPNRDPRIVIKIGENLYLYSRMKEIERNFLVRFFDFLFDDCEANTLLFNDRTKKIINSYEERKYFRQVNSTVYQSSYFRSCESILWCDSFIQLLSNPRFFPRLVSTISMRLHVLSLLFSFFSIKLRKEKKRKEIIVRDDLIFFLRLFFLIYVSTHKWYT